LVVPTPPQLFTTENTENHVGTAQEERLGCLDRVGRDELGRRPARKGRRAGEDLVGQAAEGVEIGAVVGRGIGGGLLGRHVGQRAERHAERGETGGCARAGDGHGLGHPEVGDGGSAAGYEHVVGLDVPVHDPVVMSVGQRLGYVAEQGQGLGHGQGTARQPRAQRLALDERHGIVGDAVALPGGEQWNDVRVVEPGGEPNLLPEAFAAHGVGQLGRQDLDHHPAAERGLLGEEDARHAAAAELALEGVGGTETALQGVAEVGDEPDRVEDYEM
jgi:hypothetical protein